MLDSPRRSACAEDRITLSYERRPRELFIYAGPTKVITIARPNPSGTTMVIVPRQVTDLTRRTPEAIAAAIADGYAARLAE
jgi:hypothetical protein